jgi:predicted RNase H-like nuclease
MYIGVDGCPDGWVAVAYTDTEFVGAQFHPTVRALWETHRSADRILVDVPIGLRAASSEPRRCDTEARSRLSPHRHHSVFPTPVRAAAHEQTYEAAKATQEARTDGSLNRQSWGIAPNIAETDRLLKESPAARDRIRESHPELCFWAFAGRPMRYSKTAEQRRAYWERVGVLRERDPDVYDHLWTATEQLDNGAISTDDLVDAFAVALTARGDATGLQTVPETPDHDEEGLPMEIVYRPAE